MFSSTRMVTCTVTLTDREFEPTPVNLKAELPDAWRTWLKRGHTRVVRQFATWRCDERRARGGDPHLTVDIRCKMPDGTITRSIPATEDLCGS